MKFKKLRKVYRIFFPKTLPPFASFEEKLRVNPEIIFFEKAGDLYRVVLKNKSEVYLRGDDSSDYLVFEQIFNFKEYQILLTLLSLNQYSDKEIVMIDAGANVGFTTLFFANNLKNVQIYSIEPSAENINLLKKNVNSLKKTNTIKIYENALSHEKDLLFDLDRDFRDGKDWAITTKQFANGTISGITIDQIIEQNSLIYISFLKIDIEGAERIIFDSASNVDFLSMTKLIAIEIHDEYEIRESILKVLKDHHFMLMESGELTIGINTKLL